MFGNAGQTNYGAAKAGIAAFTVIAARELARYGVTVNAVAPGALTRMTEDLSLGQASEADRDAMHPRWIAPIVTWLASRESSGVTGRIFEATGRLLAVAEGWHRGPGAEPVDDPTMLGPIVADLVARVRKNSGMDGATWTEARVQLPCAGAEFGQPCARHRHWGRSSPRPSGNRSSPSAGSPASRRRPPWRGWPIRE